MDACLDYLTNEMCQMNTGVDCINHRQARMDSFAPSPSPSPSPSLEASVDEDDDASDDEDEFTYIVPYFHIVRLNLINHFVGFIPCQICF